MAQNISNFNNVNNMPGMQPINGPQGLASITYALLNKVNLNDPAQYESYNSLNITSPTVGFHGIGPLGQIIPKV
jgi:hypothetical protein